MALLAGCLTYYWLDWDWRNDLYIIADDTITFVHKRPFFLQNLRDQILVERIDNVESVSSGLFPALLKYGDVSMSLVGADQPKLFIKVSNPQEIQQEISRRQHNTTLRRARYDAMQQRQILGEYLGVVQGDGIQPTAANYINAAAGGDQAANADARREARFTGGIRIANNPDRNRPSRLPRKTLSLQERQSSSEPGLSIRHRPQRFRPDQPDQARDLSRKYSLHASEVEAHMPQFTLDLELINSE